MFESVDAASANPSRTFSYFEAENLHPSQTARIEMRLDGSAGSPYWNTGFPLSGRFESILDPQLQIDPAYEVSYNEQRVPATDLYALAFSPEVVPEPDSLALNGVGLIAAALTAVERRRDRRHRISTAPASRANRPPPFPPLRYPSAASGIQLPWKPHGTRCGNATRATGAASKRLASSTTSSLRPLLSSCT